MTQLLVNSFLAWGGEPSPPHSGDVLPFLLFFQPPKERKRHSPPEEAPTALALDVHSLTGFPYELQEAEFTMLTE